MAVAVVVTLDGEVHDPSVPLLYADELAAVRGDGAFETALVRAALSASWKLIWAGWLHRPRRWTWPSRTVLPGGPQ